MEWLINDALPVLARIFIVWIFPFSFLDKIINHDAAVAQAKSSWLPGGAAMRTLSAPSCSPTISLFDARGTTRTSNATVPSFSVITIAT
ncbi:MAG TPA: hypothetical protein PKA74_02260 [Bauldia sp.]|nr:hypothetical protein [Bauldia sp.]